MKKNNHFVFMLALMILSAGSLTAQKRIPKEFNGQKASEIIPGANFLREGNNTSYPSFVKLDESVNVNSVEFVSWLKKALNLDSHTDFKLVKSETDELGFEHVRYVQTYKGIPVDKSTYIAHFKSGKLVSFNGIALDMNAGLSTAVSLDEKSALGYALNKVGAEKYMWEDEYWENNLKSRKGPSATYYPQGKLVWIQLKDLTMRLAYKFDVHASNPHSSQQYFIDALNGEVLNIIPLEHNCSGATVNTIFNGNQSINTDKYTANDFRLRDDCQAATVRVRDWNSTTTASNPIEIENTTNTWTTNDERFGGSVLWQVNQSYDYYLNIHSRASTDNANGIIEAYINAIFTCSTCPGGVTANNASMSGDGVTMKVGLGNGGTLDNSYATIDIIGHEYTHAVTGFSAGLVYQDESGALNESFSDIFGELIENFTFGSNDWLLGEERTNGAIRSMSSPNDFNDPDTYGGTNWCDYTNGALNCTTNDLGGVHINSGVQNYWFYLLTVGGTGTNDNGDDFSVNGIGLSKARAIAYRNLTVYLGANSTFADARTGAINAAVDLYGACSDEAKQVTNAWHAVGVGARAFSATAIVTSDYKGRDVSCFNACDGSANIVLESAFLPTYQWSNGANSQMINSLCPGTYTVTVTNIGGLGCSETSSITLNNTPELVAPALTLSNYNGYNIACNGFADGIAIVNPSGGTSPYSYLWSDGQTTASADGLVAGTYTVTVTDFNGCTITRSATLTEPPVLVTAAAPTTNYNGYNVRCFGNNDGAANAYPSGGVPPYTYSWSDGQSTNPATDLYALTYTVTVTDDNGCIETSSTTLTEPPMLTIDAGPNKIVYYGFPDSSCTDLTSSLPGGGVPPYVVTWSTGSSDETINVCPIATTVYYRTVTDANDCSTTDSVQVCVFDVRCGTNLNKVIMCHVTGNPSNPNRTVCLGLQGVINHFANHPGDQLAACGTIKECEFPDGPRYVVEETPYVEFEKTLLEAQPNPFANNANIHFMIPDNDFAVLQLVDVTGRVLSELYSGEMEGGVIYDATVDGTHLKNGIYFIVLKSSNEGIQTRKLILQK